MPEVKVPFYGHARQYHNIKKEIDDAISGVLESGQYVMGPAVGKFEGEFAKYYGTKHAIGLNSGTDALWLVFMALDRKGEAMNTSQRASVPLLRPMACLVP